MIDCIDWMGFCKSLNGRMLIIQYRYVDSPYLVVLVVLVVLPPNKLTSCFITMSGPLLESNDLKSGTVMPGTFSTNSCVEYNATLPGI